MPSSQRTTIYVCNCTAVKGDNADNLPPDAFLPNILKAGRHVVLHFLLNLLRIALTGVA